MSTVMGAESAEHATVSVRIFGNRSHAGRQTKPEPTMSEAERVDFAEMEAAIKKARRAVKREGATYSQKTGWCAGDELGWEKTRVLILAAHTALNHLIARAALNPGETHDQ